MPDTEQIQATVMDTVFRNDENGYSVVSIRYNKKQTTAVGVLPELAGGEKVTFGGSWITHPQYGKQFKAVTCNIEKPSTLSGIERYLASGLIRGVGPATAKTIVQEFGKKTLDILGESPDRLEMIPGIGHKRAVMIAESYREQYGTRQAMVFLQTYGVSPALAMKISKKYGNRAQDLIRENPYRMVDDIDGVGFSTADRIALAMGIAQDSEYRVRSGLKYVLRDASMAAGHTFLPKDVLLYQAARMLRVNDELVGDQLNRLLLSRELIASDTDGGTGIYLPLFFLAENDVAVRLAELLGASQETEKTFVKLQIAEYEKTHGIQFSPQQRTAIAMTVENGLIVITGGPGTGKTTLINCILSLMGDHDSVLLAAPTGRAAKRMSEATGREAKTLHRLLGYGGDDASFQHDETNPLDCSCVIVDEMSMVDIFLMRSLLRALKAGTRLILVGDADQLPSVGAGNVLGDILKSRVIPSVRLTDIFRQDGQSLIVQNAHAINHGELPILNRRDSDFFFERRMQPEDALKTIVDLVQNRLPRYLKASDITRTIQVLSPTKKGACGVITLNLQLQNALNPAMHGKKELTYGDTVFREGDKVMHIRNNYQLEWTSNQGPDGQGVFNGDIGYVTQVDEEERTLDVLYDDERTVTYEYGQLEELELAYCLSVHKSQGSEFNTVVMPVVGGPPMLLTRNLFYTALTRARKLVVLCGREDAIAAMVNNNHIARRYTSLSERLFQLPGVRIC